MEKRNLMSVSDIADFMLRLPSATWKEWTISNSVKDGYTASGWVYRAVSIISRNLAQVPIVVYNNENEIEWDHPLTQLFAKPNPRFGSNNMLQLLTSWLNLAGEGYWYRNIVAGRTTELWPITPDRIVVKTISPDGLQVRYEEILTNGVAPSGLQFNEQTIIPFMLPDPANPFKGIGPLQVAARAVDTDSDQTAWNKAAMQNRGVLDGFFSFDRDITDDNTFNFLLAKIKERFSGAARAREPGVIGSSAKYTRLSLGPVEMDFLNSRKFNREEIFIIFGVPPQLAGVTDTMTYNNFESALRILWEATILPLLDVILGSLNNAFANELAPGYYIGADTSNIKALKQAESEKAGTAKLYFDMGVPVSLLNEKFELGLTEYDGWDVSAIGMQQPQPSVRASKEEFAEWELRAKRLNLKKTVALRDKLAEGVVKSKFEEMLQEQQEVIFAALDAGKDPQQALEEVRAKWDPELQKVFLYVADHFQDVLVTDERKPK